MENILNCSPERFVEEELNFAKILEDPENWRHIPSINHTSLDNFKDCSLVRFRGMVQDMLDPEFYLEKYEIMSKSCEKKIRMQQGKYRDCLVMSDEESVNYSSTDNVHSERRTLFLVSIPGQNEWALDMEKSNLILPRENDGQNTISNNAETSQGVKRPCDEQESMEVDEQTSNKRCKSETNANETKNSTNPCLSSEYLINSPIVDRPGKACIIKIYNDFENHSLHTLVDVVGFLSVDPALDGTTMEPDENGFEDMNEIQANNPPPSLIPRIHAIAVRKLDHMNPLLDLSISNSTISDSDFNMEAIHKDLNIVLTQCLFGDTLAAAYLLSHLISTVYVRTDFETLGQFSLNLCNIPVGVFKEYTNQFYNIIESMLPTSHYLPMTLENLNLKQFIPTKDYTTNKLTSGILQLAPHTHLVLDETQLEPGKLEAAGVKAIQSLASLIKNQQIKYNFKFYELDFNTNIPVLVFSEGKSMLPSNFQVPIEADPDNVPLIEETLKAAKHYLQPKLNAIRIYLTRAKLSKFNLKPEDSEIIEKDFVEMRKSKPSTDAEVLHKHLILSRLLGIASGGDHFDQGCWQQAKEMEKTRIARLDRMPKRSAVRN